MPLFKNLPPSFHILFITAMRPESKVLLEIEPLHETFRKGRLRMFQHPETPVGILETGMGIPDGAEEISIQVERFKPTLLINFGLCGGLAPASKINQYFLVNRVMTAGKPVLNLENDRPEPYLSIAKEFVRESLLTVSAPVTDQQLRNHLFQQFHCGLIDMEGYFLAQMAKKLSLPLFILKLVSDRADENTPQTVKENLPEFKLNLRRALRKFLRELFEKLPESKQAD